MRARFRRLSVLFGFTFLAATAAGSDAGSITRKTIATAPLLGLIDQFTAADVPARGPAEIDTPRNWPEPANPAPVWPGRGLAQHPMLYAGEGHNELFLVNEGRVIWSYATGRGGEIDDVWMLTNGHILYTRQNYLEEITPKKEVVWHYDAPAGTEIHSCQPIGYDRVLFVQNGLPPKAIIFNKASRAIESEHELPAESLTDPKTVHAQFRRIRLTAQGTYLLQFLKMHKVVEFDRDFAPIWTYEIATPWAAVRLHNGNTLIVSERNRLVREVNRAGETVWEFSSADLPAGMQQGNIQTADRLQNGNTVIFSSTGGKPREDRPNLVQAIEVTPDKQVVWALQDWKNLGRPPRRNSSTIRATRSARGTCSAEPATPELDSAAKSARRAQNVSLHALRFRSFESARSFVTNS